MKTIELKHIAPYLPYGLKYVNTENTEYTFKVDCAYNTHVVLRDDDSGLQDVYFCEENPHLMPILYPLSWLTKEIEHNGEKFVPAFVFLKNDYKQWELEKMKVADYFKELKSVGAVGTIKGWPNSVDYRIDLAMKGKHELEVFQKFFEWHFDVFGLIPAGLAIDKSTIK